MKVLILVILLLVITMPIVSGHAKIVHTHPESLKAKMLDSEYYNKFQREFFTILINVIVGIMVVTVLVVYREDIPILKKLDKK